MLLALFAYYGGFFGSQEPSKEATGPDSPANGSFTTSQRAPGAGLETAWMEAKRTATREAWQRFIDAHPDGDHAAKARQALAAIDAAEARERADRAAWTAAEKSGTRAELQRYLEAYPDGGHAAKARQALAAIDAAEARERAERAELERTEAKARASASLKGAKPAPQAARKGMQEPAAGQRWPSADEPFMGADARIRR